MGLNEQEPAGSALGTIHSRLREAAARDPHPDWRSRDARLTALERLIRDNQPAIAEAIRGDFGNRSLHETQLLEIFPSLEGIRYTRHHLKSWMRPERRHVSLWFMPGRARVLHQPLGVVGVIVPWNYPLYLAVGPLTAALAAGNRAMVKMSEYTPAMSALFARLAEKYFAADEVAVVQGDAEVAQAFARLPFGHLLFTGSTKVGYSVMRAAAENLTPVTLELGGKSPAILGPDYPLETFAERVVVGKTMNAGQTCIAPDYVLVPAGQEHAFIAAAQKEVNACYPDILRTPDYSSIVSERHYRRLLGLVEDARGQGAEAVPLSAAAHPDAATRRIPPVALLNVSPDMQAMQEEIFGPVLPVVPYRDLDEAIRYVNARPNPLALYYFDRDRGRIDQVLERTLSGGVTINDTILHIAQDSLPFGGVGESGKGHYHGFEGFEAFSKKKAVFYQSRLNGMGLFKPPYGALFERMVKFLIR
ncbi:MAG: coniferyl aldehyde dehydrogenase [Zoogloeaceae bacterium]|nr:coniferyl aldehyde dehydrogenase [Zoogloeaceae bacterium]MCK6384378.1 coniferyl aldehyde dehydrogenase [Rhodocyclaceae bacterium]